MYTVGHTRIVSMGDYTPPDCIRSDELLHYVNSKERFGISENWLQRVTGIKERRHAPANMKPSDMAVTAAREALERGRLLIKDIDAVCYAGMMRDHSIEPSTAHVVQAKLGIEDAYAFDVSNACLSFVSGIHLMDSLIATGQVRRGLIVAGEKPSVLSNRALEAMLDIHDKKEFHNILVGLTLGDAGTAMILGPKERDEPGFMGFNLKSKGQHAYLCYCGTEDDVGLLYTDMPKLVKAGTGLNETVYKELFDEKLGWAIKDVDHYIPHQTGKITFKLHSEATGISPSKMCETVITRGNLVAATIPVNLYNLQKNNRVNAGQKVGIVGAGSGVCAGHAGLIWDDNYGLGI